MNAVDGSDHYSKTSDEPPPSLLTIILDTNPHAWTLLEPTLPFSTAVANLIVFINAHLAISNTNKIAIIASHSRRAEFIYPLPSVKRHRSRSKGTPGNVRNGRYRGSAVKESGVVAEIQADIDMLDDTSSETLLEPQTDANHYRPFQEVQSTICTRLKSLFASTLPDDLTATTAMAGAMTLALTFINRQHLQSSSSQPGSGAAVGILGNGNMGLVGSAQPALNVRILILSVSGDLAHQYIPIMNSTFACQRLAIPIDICKIAGDTVFLQQASDATKGTYMKLNHPQGLLQYLMMGFLADQTSRKSIIQPNRVGVDFRAACFCHRKIVDIGYICSVCLSIFCSPPPENKCLTCGTQLQVGSQGSNPVVNHKKKKRVKDK